MRALPADQLREVLLYAPDTGLFVRKNGRTPRVVGKVHRSGYVQIQVGKSYYYAHRLAWLYVHGAWPEDEIDHINNRRDDNRIANLRAVTRSQNMQNRPLFKSNTSGLRGVYWGKNAGRWQAAIQVAGKKTYLGLFDSPESAYAAYCDAAEKLHTHNPVIPQRKAGESIM